jgi:hypothetical protein
MVLVLAVPDSAEAQAQDDVVPGNLMIGDGEPAIDAEEPQGDVGLIVNHGATEPRTGVFSLGLAFGSQASPYGREAAGALIGTGSNSWIGAYIQAGHNSKSRKSAYGCHVELGFDVSNVDRARLSVVPIVAYGYSIDEELDTQEVQWGAALALQLEVFLIKQISTAVRIEAGGQLAPGDELRLSTATSELLLFYHLR